MDQTTTAERSENMRRIRSTGMKPEMVVRRVVHSLGYRYRLHRQDLPGRPDLVFASKRKIIFVHGCFWHQHKCCKRSHRPRSNLAYWLPKLRRNVLRDRKHMSELASAGWTVLLIWECETREIQRLAQTVDQFLRGETTWP